LELAERDLEVPDGPLSLSKTMIVGLSAEKASCPRTGGDGMLASYRDGAGGGKQKSILSSYRWKDKVSACTSITAL